RFKQNGCSHAEHRSGRSAARDAGAPAWGARRYDAVHGEKGSDHHSKRSGQIETLPKTGARDRREQWARKCESRHADRHVDQEDPVPADTLGEDAAKDNSEGPATGAHEAPDAHRLGTVRSLRK